MKAPNSSDAGLPLCCPPEPCRRCGGQPPFPLARRPAAKQTPDLSPNGLVAESSVAARLPLPPSALSRTLVRFRLGASWILLAAWAAAVPVEVVPNVGSHGMVVAGHPEAAAIGADILLAGGNAMDAAVGVSLALGVAEPYGSGLGGKLMLLYHDAATGLTHAVDGLDQAGAHLDVGTYRGLPTSARSEGWTAVAVPGLPFALHAAHARWGSRAWADNVQPAADLARRGFTVLPKTRALFAERESRLRGDVALAALYLPGGELPAEGTRLASPELAGSLELFASEGILTFRAGSLAERLVAASRRGGGHLAREDFANYEPRFIEPLRLGFHGFELYGGPPPATGAALAFAILKVLEEVALTPPLRSAANLDLIGKVWQLVLPTVREHVADSPAAVAAWQTLLEPASLADLRAKIPSSGPAPRGAAAGSAGHDATSHFVVVDRHGNVVSATQSLSLHFGAGAITAGIIVNNSMANFSYQDPASPNFVAPGRRPRTTITPTIILRHGQPVLALGVPGAQRIPTAVAQVLLDHLQLGRPLAAAIGDTRVHWFRSLDGSAPDTIEAESSLPPVVADELRARGWAVALRETPGTGRHFGGVNAIHLRPDGSREGFADPRRTNAAVGH